ncbi:MAG: diguanylate cyclase [Peptostreptococcaceae bacterium]|nr:diguanylate cyclase [Peptostreptococcaceae bacterium]
MKIINDKYKILNLIEEKPFISTYRVLDLYNDNFICELKILNVNSISSNFEDMYREELLKTTYFNNDFMLKFYDLSKITRIDGEIVEEDRYLYTCEIKDNKISLDGMEINDDNFYEIFTKIIKIMIYIKTSNYNYMDLKLEDFYMVEDELYLQDLFSKHIKNYLNNYDYNLKGLKSILNDPKQYIDVLNLKNILSELGKSLDLSIRLENKIHELIEILNDINFYKKYKNAKDFINLVQDLFDESNDFKLKDFFNKVNKNTEYINNERELKIVLDNIKDAKEDTIDNKIFFVKGDYGIGKTRFLLELKKILNFHGFNSYDNLIVDTYGNIKSFNRKKIFENTLDCILKTKDLTNYEKDLIKNYKEGLLNINDLKSLERLNEIIQDNLNDSFRIFLIDDIKYIDDFSLELLKYLNYNKNNQIKNIFICSIDRKIKNDIRKILKNIYTQTIDIRTLTLNTTIEFLRNLFNTHQDLDEFATLIYKETYGNPKSILFMIDKLIQNNLIYFDENKFIWNTNKAKEENLIYDFFEGDYEEKLKTLNINEYEILKYLSSFKNPIEEDIVKELLSNFDFDYFDHLKNLISKGFINKKVQDLGYAYDFYKKNIKNNIYKNISDSNKINIHKKIIISLKNIYEDKDLLKDDEIIYQLEKSNEKEELLKYIILMAKKMKNLKIRDEAIKYYEKAYYLIEERERKFEIAKELGELYFLVWNNAKSIYFYEEAYEIVFEKNLYKDRVDILNRIIALYINSNFLNYALIYLQKVEKLLEEFSYNHGKIEYYNNIVRYYLRKEDYKKLETTKEGLNYLFESADFKHKGKILYIKSKIELEIGDYKKSLEYLNESLKLYYKAEYLFGVCESLILCSEITLNYEQNFDKSIDFLNRALNLSIIHGINYTKIKSKIYLAYISFYTLEYKKSAQHIQDVIREINGNSMQTYLFVSYVILANIFFENNLYKQGYKYYNKAKKELEKYPNQGRWIGEYYRLSAIVDLLFGNFKKGFKESQLNYSKIKFNNRVKIHYDIIQYYLKLYLKEDSSKVILNEIEYLIKKIKNKREKLNLYHHLFYTSHILGLKSDHFLKKFLEYSRGSEDNDYVLLKKEYMLCLHYEDKRKEYHLKQVLEISKKLENNRVYWFANIMLGDYYFKNNNYFDSINYYLEGAIKIESLLENVEDNERENFIDINNIKKSICKIKKLKYLDRYKELRDINCTKDEIAKVDIFNRNFVDISFMNEVLNNKVLKENIKQLYTEKANNINDIYDLIGNFKDDTKKNIDLILNYIESLSYATKGLLIIEEDGKFDIISGGKDFMEDNLNHTIQRILSEVSYTKRTFSINCLDSSRTYESFSSNFDIKAIICLPIYFSNKNLKEKRQNRNIKAYLYLETDKILNNFNDDLFEKLEKLNNLISLLVQNYKFKTYSFLDKLTGAYNRKYLEEHVLNNLKTYKNESCIFIMDLDHFKNINDKFGHQFGDYVLKQFSKLVKESIRDGDLFCRYGGEEFFLLLPNTSLKEGLAIGDRIRKHIYNNLYSPNKRSITVSIGMSVYPIDATDGHEILKNADNALYKAKKEGRNRIVRWEEDVLEIQENNYIKNNTKDTSLAIDIVNFIEDMNKILNYEINKDEFMFRYLKGLSIIINAYEAIFIDFKDDKIYKVDNRINKNYLDPSNLEINENILDEIKRSSYGIYKIDWDNIVSRDPNTDMPNLNSILGVRVKVRGKDIGILYFKSLKSQKEFKQRDLHIVSRSIHLLGIDFN